MCSESRPERSIAVALMTGAAAALVACAIWSPRIVGEPLRHWDEAWYAQVSREMLREESWLTVRWNGSPWFHKPPLTFWGTMLSFWTFGVHEWSARLVSLLSGVSVVGVLSAVATRWTNRTLGLSAGFFLIALPEFGLYAVRGQIDVPLTLWVTLALFAFWRGITRPRSFLLLGMFAGLALMTKGAAAGLIGVVIASYMVVARDGRPLRQVLFYLAPVVAVAVAAPWHVHQSVVHGEPFVRDYFSRHLAQFFVDIYPEQNAPSAPAGYYLDFLLRKRGIWGWPTVLLCGWGAWRLARGGGDRRLAFTWCWVVATVAALSLSWAKWHWYLVPIYPGVALLAVLLLRDRRIDKRWVLAASVLLAGLASVDGWTRDVVREWEGEIRAIAPVVREKIGVGGRFLTLQVASAKESVYPIAARFYVDREVQAVEGVERLEAIVESAGNVVPTLLTAGQLDEVIRRGQSVDGASQGYDVYVIAREGPVVFAELWPKATR